jgi:2-polyprenyl-3-methyl-5-hydroxy-6-metoxy-1,4-benzoquinol methylase
MVFFFHGKKCLDIGTRDGLNCTTLVNLGAREVIGIDTNDSRFNEMKPNEKITLIKKNLLDMDETEKFDIITCFLWNMKVPLYDKIMLKIKSLLNINGIVYIGISPQDNEWYIDDNSASVPKLLERHFSNVRQLILEEPSPFQLILEATKPL